MFIKSEKHPSPPFTRNYLTHKMLNKKVKGEGLKTLFYIYARQEKKRKGTLGSKIGKTLKKEYNIRFKIYPSPRHHNTYPSSYSQHLFSWIILRRYSAIYRRYFRILRRYSAIFRSNFRVNEFRNVIVWEAEEPIRYRPQQTNLMNIRTKSNELSLFNPKKQLFMK